MAIRESARLFCLFVAGTVVCAAQQDQRTTAMQWADHYAAFYQVPRELVHAIIEVESAWNPRAVSIKGAVGLMQLRHMRFVADRDRIFRVPIVGEVWALKGVSRRHAIYG